jgi:acyl-[acyl-carrier-protein]-phospholipid O-acyltransferase/long-chain-fatty-acid--[acyl-carrier-protein] ligase
MDTGNANRTRKRSAEGKFAAMAATYCLGVFNDNYFKQAAMLVAVSAGLIRIQGTATVLFAFPFIAFSAYAGWLADRFPKRKVVIGAKAVELIAMLIGAAGIVTGNWLCILSMVFLMGMQSCFFGPALNGAIPELYAEHEVPRANAILKLTTTLAILAGIATAGISLDQNWMELAIPFGKVLVAAAVVLVAVFGFLASFGAYGHAAAGVEKSFPWSGPIRSLVDFLALRHDRQLFLAILADAYFYFVASLAVLVINSFGLQQLGFSRTVTSLLSMFLMIGVCLGSLIAARITVIQRWFRTLGPAAFGMAASLFTCSLTPLLPVGLQLVWLSSSLVSTGIWGGIFLIPVTSFLQVRPAAADKGQVLATAGFCSFIGILLSGTVFSTLISPMRPSAAMGCLSGFALIAAVVFTLALKKRRLLSAAVLLPVVRFLLRLRYRIQVTGLEKLPAEDGKGILFLPNHPALIDPVICQNVLYSRFRPRPLVDFDQGSKPFVKWIMKGARPILIPDLTQKGRNSRADVKQALNEVCRCLEMGENVVLYPAGRIYRSAREDLAGNSGVEFVLKAVPDVQVVLIRTSGLWGSSFSFAQGAEPSLFKHFKKYLAAILANGIFFGPRRDVMVRIFPDKGLKKLSDRLAINGYLEAFYNRCPQPNTHVPYFWWQGGTARIMPEPARKSFTGDVTRVPASTRKLILEKIEKISGAAEIRETDRLAHDLAIDSLSLMELAVWLENEFGLSVDDIGSLVTVADCLLAANGRIMARNEKPLHPVAASWFQGKGSERLIYPSEKTITAAFLCQAKKDPNAVVLADQISGAKTYRQIITAVFALKPIFEKIDGNRVGIMLPASVSAAIVYLAILFAGKTPVLINWTTGVGNMQHGLERTGVRHIVTATLLKKKLSEQSMKLLAVKAEWLYIDKVAATIPLHRKILAALQSVACLSRLTRAAVPETAAILFTSGSESRPKAVPLSHENIMANMKDFAKIVSFRGNDRLLGMLPPFHSLGLVGTIILPLCLALKTVYHPNPTESTSLARLIGHYKVSTLIGTPTFLNGIVQAATGEQLASLKLLFTGAEKCPDHVYRAFHDHCPQVILCEGYGITECSPLVSINHPENPKAGTIGKVLPSIEYALIHPDTGERIDKGEQGLLLVRGPSIFSGYCNDHDRKGFFQFEGKSWYETGDFVREDVEGHLIFCGRQKRFIKLAGEMVSLPAIESALQKYLPATDDNGPAFAVEATPTDGHPEIVLFTTIAMDREKANSFIRSAGLSPLHNIRKVEDIDAIPVLGTGKTDYKQLQARLAA